MFKFLYEHKFSLGYLEEMQILGDSVFLSLKETSIPYFRETVSFCITIINIYFFCLASFLIFLILAIVKGV